MDMIPEKYRGKRTASVRTLGLIAAALGVGLAALCFCFAAAHNQPAAAADKLADVELPQVSYASYRQAEGIPLTLKATSVERDLNIYILDEDEMPVTNVAFEVVATNQEGEATTLKDEEATGKIHAKDIEPGKYTLALEETGRFIVPKPLEVEVRDKVKEEVIEDIDEKITNAKNTDTTGEEPGAGGDNAPTVSEAPPADTVAFLESKKLTKDVDKSVALLDANGVQVLKYRPVPSESGKLLLYDGSESEHQVQTDAEGYIVQTDTEIFDENGKPRMIAVPIEQEPSAGGVQTEEVSAGAGEQPPATEPADPPATMNVQKYKLEEVPQFTTVKERVTTYQGWQTLDGKRYYYNAAGKPVTGSQVIQGVPYIFDSKGVLQQTVSTQKRLGIDVSTFQQDIDWATARANGLHFAMIRAGYRGYTKGGLIEDDRFRTHARGAQAAGVKVGIYYFSQAVNEVEAVEEASAAIAIARKYGVNVSYPIAIDIEYINSARVGRADHLSGAQRTAIARAFCNTVRNAGYTPMVYSSSSWFGNGSYLSFSGQSHWVAQWPTANGAQRGLGCQPEERADRGWGIWQFTSHASIPGVPGRVDANYSYLGY